MRSYIVSIYRDGKGKSRGIVGVVEEVGKDGKKAFTNYDELWEILHQRRKAGRRGAADRLSEGKAEAALGQTYPPIAP